MFEAFILRRYNGNILTGKAGDYIVKSENRVWIVEKDIFEKTYAAE